MIATPTNPTAAASQRRQPIGSRSTVAAKAVAISTSAMLIAVASAKGIWMIEVRPQNIDPTAKNPRVRCKLSPVGCKITCRAAQ